MGSSSSTAIQQQWALPPPLFLFYFFYLVSMSGSGHLIVFPSPDLLKYLNVIVIEFYRIFIYNISRVL